MGDRQTFGFTTDVYTAQTYVSMLMLGSVSVCTVAHQKYAAGGASSAEYQSVIQAIIDVLELNRFLAAKVAPTCQFEDIIREAHLLKAEIAELGGKP